MRKEGYIIQLNNNEKKDIYYHFGVAYTPNVGDYYYSANITTMGIASKKQSDII